MKEGLGEFFSQLYENVAAWQNARGAIKVCEFGPQEIRRWGWSGNGRQGLELSGGGIWRYEDTVMAMSMGLSLPGGWRFSSDDHLLQFQFLRVEGHEFTVVPISLNPHPLLFGTDPKPFSRQLAEVTASDLGFIMDQLLSPGGGKIYFDRYRKEVRLNCVDDHPENGGSNVRNWSQDRLLSAEGLEACLDIVKRAEMSLPTLIAQYL